MFKKFLIYVSCFLICVSCVYAQETEKLTITTYYPSPYGSYREVSAYRMKIGTDYSDASYSISDNNLIVEGNVGIGTASPGEKLDVAGSMRITGSGNRIAFVDTDGFISGQKSKQALEEDAFCECALFMEKLKDTLKSNQGALFEPIVRVSRGRRTATSYNYGYYWLKKANPENNI